VDDFISPLKPSFKLGFRPKSKLDSRIQFQTKAQVNFGFRLSFKPSLKPRLKPSFGEVFSIITDQCVSMIKWLECLYLHQNALHKFGLKPDCSD